MGYLGKAIEGFSWQTVLKIASALVILVKISVLARLLTPADFGLFSLVLISLGLSEAAAQTGINLTILQSKRSVDYFINTAWVIAIARGLIIAIAMISLSFGLSWYFNQPQLVPLIALTSLVPVIKGLINPTIICLQKDLKFFQDSLYQFSLVVIESMLSVLLGWWLQNVTALIFGMIGAAIFEVTISFIFFKLRPRFEFIKSRAEVIFHNARWISLSSLLGYLNNNLDDLVIGKLVGTYQLGLYHNAYALTHRANYDLTRSLHRGTLPIYTKFADDQVRMKKAIIKMTGWFSVLLLCASAILLIFPQFVVNLILGDQWLAVIPLIKWLVLAGVVHSYSLIGYTYLMAQAKYRFLNIHQLINLILTISLIIIWGQQTGLIGAVTGLAVGRLLALPVIIYGVIAETKST